MLWRQNGFLISHSKISFRSAIKFFIFYTKQETFIGNYFSRMKDIPPMEISS